MIVILALWASDLIDRNMVNTIFLPLLSWPKITRQGMWQFIYWLELWDNWGNYESFGDLFEKAFICDQSRSCTFNRLEMTSIRRWHVLFENNEKNEDSSSSWTQLSSALISKRLKPQVSGWFQLKDLFMWFLYLIWFLLFWAGMAELWGFLCKPGTGGVICSRGGEIDFMSKNRYPRLASI